MASTKNIRYRVNCDIHRLKINKNIDFETKVTWKRNQAKAQTTTARHVQGFSVFNQTLSLEFNLLFNTDTMVYESKKTELVVVIEYQGKIKNGGYAKYDICENLNTNPHGVSKVNIPLTQCPDPAAFLQASFSYERVSQEIEPDNTSVLNATSNEINHSRIDFHDDKLSLQMERINETIMKFENLSEQINKKAKDSGKKAPEGKAQIEAFESEKRNLQNTIKKLQKQIEQKDQQFDQQRKKVKKQTDQLVKQLQKKNKQSKQVKLKQKNQYKQLYQNALKQLQELRSNDMVLKKSLDFKFASQMEDVKQVANFQSKSAHSDEDDPNAQDLARQNVQLQSKVASMSHKLAQLFNASYEYGGAKLLDYLQTSIGLTQLE